MKQKSWALILLLFVVGAAVGFWVGLGQDTTPPDQVVVGPTRDIKLYFYDSLRDRDANGNMICSAQGLVSVVRKIPITQTPIQDSVRQLMAGQLTQSERAQGITTDFPLDGFGLVAASVRDRVLTLTFSDPRSKSTGGSCKVNILSAQVTATAKQFGGVDEVRFMPESIFQP